MEQRFGLVDIFRYLVKLFIQGRVGMVKTSLIFGYVQELFLDITDGVSD